MKMIEGPSPIYRPHVYVMFIGQHFLPTVLESAKAAADDAAKSGVNVTIGSVNDMCVTPFHGLGAMRNLAIMRAMEANASHVLIIDNDIKLTEPSVLLRLVEASKLAVTPYFDQTPCERAPGVWSRPQYPTPEPGQGLVPIDWVIMNCVLFDLAIFRMLGPRLFTDPMITNEEDYLFTYLRLYGVRLWQDTNAVVEMLRAPTKLWEIIPGGRLMNLEKANI